MIEAETILSLLFFLHRALPTADVQNFGEKRSRYTLKSQFYLKGCGVSRRWQEVERQEFNFTIWGELAMPSSTKDILRVFEYLPIFKISSSLAVDCFCCQCALNVICLSPRLFHLEGSFLFPFPPNGARPTRCKPVGVRASRVHTYTACHPRDGQT